MSKSVVLTTSDDVPVKASESLVDEGKVEKKGEKRLKLSEKNVSRKIIVNFFLTIY